MINFVLRKVIETLTLIEKSKYYTEYLHSKIFKVFILLFFNTGFMIAITVLFAGEQSSINRLFGENGVVYNIQFIMIYSLVIPVLFSLFHPLHLIKTVRYWILRRRFRSPADPNRYTQAEANYIYEKNRFDIDYKYFSILKTVAISFFYQLIIPYGLLIAMFEMVLFYLTDRFSLTRRCLRPKEFDFALTLHILSYFDICIILLPLGYIFFFRVFFGLSVTFILYLSLALTMFEKYVISVRLLFFCCKNCEEFEPNLVRFQEINVLSYNQLNPVVMDFFVYDDRNKSMLSVIMSERSDSLERDVDSFEYKIRSKQDSSLQKSQIDIRLAPPDVERPPIRFQSNSYENHLAPRNFLQLPQATRNVKLNLLSIVQMISNRKQLIGDDKIHFDDEADTINYLQSGQIDLQRLDSSARPRRITLPASMSSPKILDNILLNKQLRNLEGHKPFLSFNSWDQHRPRNWVSSEDIRMLVDVKRDKFKSLDLGSELTQLYKKQEFLKVSFGQRLGGFKLQERKRRFGELDGVYIGGETAE